MKDNIEKLQQQVEELEDQLDQVHDDIEYLRSSDEDADKLADAIVRAQAKTSVLQTRQADAVARLNAAQTERVAALIEQHKKYLADAEQAVKDARAEAWDKTVELWGELGASRMAWPARPEHQLDRMGLANLSPERRKDFTVKSLIENKADQIVAERKAALRELEAELEQYR